MTRVLAFDVNETLLDLRALDPVFEDLLGTSSLRAGWFSQMLQLSFVGGLTGDYVDFGTAQRAALRMVAERQGRSLTDDVVEATVERMRALPPHPEVPGALARLRSSPFAVAALTNSTADVAEAQLVNAGVRHLFDAVLSADSVRALKPAAAPYQSVAHRFDVEIGEVLLIAAHAWDIAGALAAGADAAFVARPGAVLSPIGPRPSIVGRDLDDVADQILARVDATPSAA